MHKTSKASKQAPLILQAPKPRNPILQAAAGSRAKLATKKHEKSEGAVRRAEKIALSKLLPK
jgi:transposase